MTNALDRYLAEHNESLNGLAQRMGRAPSTLTRVLKGERKPSPDLALDVEEHTGGAVPAADFMAICADASLQRAREAARPRMAQAAG
jgi:plasmid maintenance system antidote protein VapI